VPWERTGTPQRLRATGHVVMPEPSRTGRQVWSHGTRGDTGALPYRAVGPAVRGDSRALLHREAVWSRGTRSDTGAIPCRAVGPTTSGDVRALTHLEQVWSRGTPDDTGALPSWVACPMPQGTWRC
jgi:hypothetical protein